MNEKQITFAPHGHLLTNANIWSLDGNRIVYDVRSSPDGSVFDGKRVETVDIKTGKIQVLYESRDGACCGVATYSPVDDRVVFILGPDHPTHAWHYGFHRRRGVIVRESHPGVGMSLDARNLTPPFTPGALRGGTHLHLFSPDGRRVSYTYHDLLLPSSEDHRNIGISVLAHPVSVPKSHERNHDGSAFSVLVTRTSASPRAGSDEIGRASEEAWVGVEGKMIAFCGEVVSANGKRKSEVFVVELPEDLAVAGQEPLQGTTNRRPAPPLGTVQRRVTHTVNGLGGARHWLRSSPDGSKIGFLMHDAEGVVQFWTVSPSGGQPRQITFGKSNVESAFSWRPDGKSIVMVIGGSVVTVDVEDGRWRAIAPTGPSPVRPEACVFSPDGEQVAYARIINGHNQIFVSSIR